MGDFSGTAKFNFDELNIFLQSVYRGLAKSCAMPSVVDQDLIDLCNRIYDETGIAYKADITKEQLIEWFLQSRHTQNFLEAFAKAKPFTEICGSIESRERAQVDLFWSLSSDKKTVEPQ